MDAEHCCRRIALYALLLPVALLFACEGTTTLGRKLWQDTYQQTSFLSVDVLFVVDNSYSMQGDGQEQERVLNAFDDFLGNLEYSTTDYHIGVTTTDMAEGAVQGKLVEADGVRYITRETEDVTALFEKMIGSLGTGKGFERGFWAAKTALYPTDLGGESGEGGYNEGFYRDDAKLAIIFVSDEDDCSDEGDPLPGLDQEECYTMKSQLRPVFEYVADFQLLKNTDEDIVVSAIVGLGNDDATEDCKNNTSVGIRYMDMVGSFGGVLGDICLGMADEGLGGSCDGDLDRDADGFIATIDCNDLDILSYPGADERIDLVDNDCDGRTDNPKEDSDGDGVYLPEDCDDHDVHVYPGANDDCGDGKDDNCDGVVDNGSGCEESYGVDMDGDGWSYPEDCNDREAEAYPGADELCDGLDSDCDGLADVPDGGCDASADNDSDGFSADEECNDNDPATYPGAAELCDRVDNDCDGVIESDCLGIASPAEDVDGDGYNAPGDCNDREVNIHPEASESCDGIDNNCKSGFSDSLEKMGLSAVLSTRFLLSREPEVSTLEIYVNDVKVESSEGWSYDEAANAIDFWDSVPPSNSIVMIQYFPAAS